MGLDHATYGFDNLTVLWKEIVPVFPVNTWNMRISVGYPPNPWVYPNFPLVESPEIGKYTILRLYTAIVLDVHVFLRENFMHPRDSWNIAVETIHF